MSFKVFKSNYEKYITDTPIDEIPLVARIFDNWQKDYYKPWRWNNSHRFHCTKELVPIHVGYPTSYSDRRFFLVKKPSFIGPYSEERYKSLHTLTISIRRVFLRIRCGESLRRHNKYHWWQENVVGGEASDVIPQYNEFLFNRMVPDLWLSIAMDIGLTWAHLRVYFAQLRLVHDDVMEDEAETFVALSHQLCEEYLIENPITNRVIVLYPRINGYIDIINF